MDGFRINDKITITMSAEDAKILEDLLGQFTFDTCMTILRDGDYPDALDGNDSEEGFEPGGFEKPYDKVVDDLHSTLFQLVEEDLE